MIGLNIEAKFYGLKGSFDNKRLNLLHRHLILYIHEKIKSNIIQAKYIIFFYQKQYNFNKAQAQTGTQKINVFNKYLSGSRI